MNIMMILWLAVLIRCFKNYLSNVFSQRIFHSLITWLGWLVVKFFKNHLFKKNLFTNYIF